MNDPNRGSEILHPLNSEAENSASFLQRQQQHIPEIRIEIHSVPNSEVNLPRNIAATMPNNLTSLLHQARTQIGRHTDSRRWEMNFRNVFQGVRPLVQRAQNINTFRTLMPNNSFPYTPLRAENEWSESDALRNNLESNVNETNSNNNNNNTRSVNEVPTVMEISRPSNSEGNSSPTRPILDRVAALTRDDPPDLLDSPASSRRNRRQGDNVEDEDAVAEVFAQVPEVRQAFNVLARYIPFICILLAKSAFDHLQGIIDLLALGGIFMHANSVVRNQVIKQTQRQISVLLRELLYIGIVVLLKLFFTNGGDVYAGILLFRALPDTLSLGQLLFLVAITDMRLKIITIIIKIFIIMLPPSIIRYKGRGRIFVLVESLSQLYRTLAPIQAWLIFLLDSYTGLEKILGMTFSSAYMVSKGFDLVERSKLCKKSFAGLLKKVNYANEPTNEDIQSAGGQCPICHDSFDTPVMLECKHIFCELCIGTWFSKQQTCPLCRCKVAEDPSWQDGATSFFLQLY